MVSVLELQNVVKVKMAFKSGNFLSYKQLLNQIRLNPRLLPNNRRLNVFDTNIHLGKKERQRARLEKQSLFLLPSAPYPIFTRNLKYLGSLSRFVLKPWTCGTAHSSYTMPFYFDRQRWLSYRIQARPLAFAFDREQRKYFLTYDVGTKAPLTLSSRPLLKFNVTEASASGHLSYTRTTSRHFFKTLPKKHSFSLYAPPKANANSTYFKSSLFSSPYNWASDILPLVFKHRFTFNRKLQVQGEDLDLLISGSQFSWAQVFSKWPTPSAFYPLLPQRYSSFLLSSSLKTKRVRFPARFFRYYHKYFLRRQYWSALLQNFWGGFLKENPVKGFFPWRYFSSILLRSGLSIFFSAKFFLQGFYMLAHVFSSIFFSAKARAFYSFLFTSLNVEHKHFSLSSWILSLCFTRPWILSFEEGAFLTQSQPGQRFSIRNSLFFSKPWAKKYLIIQLGNQVRFFARHGYYNPWKKRFAFSLRNYSFLKVFPKFSLRKRRNATARGSFQKNVYKRDWFIFDLFNGAQHRVINLFGRFLVFFARKHVTPHLFSSKLPFFLKYFFKLSRKFLGGGRSYLQEVFSLSKFLSPKRPFRSSWRPMFSFLQRNALALATRLRRLGRKGRRSRFSLRSKGFLFLNRKVQRQLWQLKMVLRRFKVTLKNNFPRRRSHNNRWWKRYPFPIALPKQRQGFHLGKAILKIKRLYEARVLLARFWKLSYRKMPRALVNGVMLLRFLVIPFLRKLPPGKQRRRLPYYVYHGLRMLKKFFKIHGRFFSSWWKGMNFELRRRKYLIKAFFTRLSLSNYNKNKAFSLRTFYWMRFWTAFFYSRGLARAFAKKPGTWNFSYPSLPSLFSPLFSRRGERLENLVRFRILKNIKVRLPFRFSPLRRLHKRLFRKVRPRVGWRRNVARKFEDEQKLIKYFLEVPLGKRRWALPSALYQQIKYALPPHPPKRKSRWDKGNFFKKSQDKVGLRNVTLPHSYKVKASRGRSPLFRDSPVKFNSAAPAPSSPSLRAGAVSASLLSFDNFVVEAINKSQRSKEVVKVSDSSSRSSFIGGLGGVKENERAEALLSRLPLGRSTPTMSTGGNVNLEASAPERSLSTEGSRGEESKRQENLKAFEELTRKEKKIRLKAMLLDNKIGADGRPPIWDFLTKKTKKKYTNPQGLLKVPERKPNAREIEIAMKAFNEARVIAEQQKVINDARWAAEQEAKKAQKLSTNTNFEENFQEKKSQANFHEEANSGENHEIKKDKVSNSKKVKK